MQVYTWTPQDLEMAMVYITRKCPLRGYFLVVAQAGFFGNIFIIFSDLQKNKNKSGNYKLVISSDHESLRQATDSMSMPRCKQVCDSKIQNQTHLAPELLTLMKALFQQHFLIDDCTTFFYRWRDTWTNRIFYGSIISNSFYKCL